MKYLVATFAMFLPLLLLQLLPTYAIDVQQHGVVTTKSQKHRQELTSVKPYGIVFDFPNPSQVKLTTQCQTELSTIAATLLPTYATEVVSESYWTQQVLVELEKNGTYSVTNSSTTTTNNSTRKNLRQRSLATRCTISICLDSPLVIAAIGCKRACLINKRERQLHDNNKTEHKQLVQVPNNDNDDHHHQQLQQRLKETPQQSRALFLISYFLFGRTTTSTTTSNTTSTTSTNTTSTTTTSSGTTGKTSLCVYFISLLFSGTTASKESCCIGLICFDSFATRKYDNIGLGSYYQGWNNVYSTNRVLESPACLRSKVKGYTC
jgi:hypothetical protein